MSCKSLPQRLPENTSKTVSNGNVSGGKSLQWVFEVGIPASRLTMRTITESRWKIDNYWNTLMV